MVCVQLQLVAVDAWVAGGEADGWERYKVDDIMVTNNPQCLIPFAALNDVQGSHCTLHNPRIALHT